MQSFRDRERARIERSGWVRNPDLRSTIDEVGLPSPIDTLPTLLSDDLWRRAAELAEGMRDHFAGYRFAASVEYGLLLVPNPTALDTRRAVDVGIRRAMHPELGTDFVDPLLGPGVDLAVPATPWTPFITTVGAYGISAGSYDDITTAPNERFAVAGIDTRTAMTRQLWGARLLQSAEGVIPDSDYNESWTFTLFPGEATVNGQAVSGTVLKGKVRFRLGKTNRGIGSARISPAIPLL